MLPSHFEITTLAKSPKPSTLIAKLLENLDPKILDVAEIFAKAYGPSYKEVNNSITDVVKKSMLTNPELRMDLYIPPGIND